jgi:glycosyltransferase involved in cell wall biosynthesis
MTPIRFGIYLADLSHRGGSSHGVVNYALGLTRALLNKLRHDERLVLYVNREMHDEISCRVGPAQVEGAARIRLLAAPRNGAERLWMDHTLSMLHASRDGLNVLHFPKGFIPLSRLRGTRIVATVHDDIPCRYVEGVWGRNGATFKMRYFAWAIRHAMRHADLVLTVSRFSQSRLQALQGQLPHRPPISVIHQGITLPHRPFVPVAERAPHILHIGSRFPHKRSSSGIATALRYLEETEVKLRLRVLGDLDDNAERLASHPLVDRVRGPMSNEDIAEEMARARTFLFSSEYEGFGLPPVEALSLGTSAIYPRVAATAEILNGTPGAYELSDYCTFRKAFYEALQLDNRQLQRLQSRIREHYSWEGAGMQTLNQYRRLVGRPDPVD